MNYVKLFKIKNDVKRINAFINKIQFSDDDNRIINIQIVGSYAYITARVGFSL